MSVDISNKSGIFSPEERQSIALQVHVIILTVVKSLMKWELYCDISSLLYCLYGLLMSTSSLHILKRREHVKIIWKNS